VDNEEKRFLFRLAGKLGKTVEQLSSQMSYREFVEWQAYLKYCMVEDNMRVGSGKKGVPREVIW
jgi:hypothetical protein